MKVFSLILSFCFSITSIAGGQPYLFERRSIEIPFEYHNNFILVDVMFNKTLPLKFIFDTGAEYTILTKREFSDVLGVKYNRSFRLAGADLSIELIAHLATGVHLNIADFVSPSENILVLDEDYFQFEELIGMEVHGLIGASIFSKYVVKINYKTRTITLYNPNLSKPPSQKYTKIPIEVIKNKPYINVKTANISTDKPKDLKLLIDTGASLPLLLHCDSSTGVVVPPTVVKGNIGVGLGGYLEGYIGRIHELKFGPFKLNGVISNFQSLESMIDTTPLKERNGILGNEILSRFEVVIDYRNELLYLKPNKNYKKAFKFDRSGLMIIVGGKNLKTFIVNEVIEGSPAYKAGVQVGDEIRRCNWSLAGYLSLKSLSDILMKKEGKKINLVLRRNGKRLKVSFRLKDLL